MNTALFFSSLPYTLLALLIWPIAHIPVGAPLFLAGKENQELNAWVMAGSLAIGQVAIAAITYILYICGIRFPLLGFIVFGITAPVWIWGAFLILRNPLKLRENKWLIFGLIFTAALLLPHVILGVVWDEGYHFSKIASILNGDHPYFVPGGTKGFLGAYHFGVDFLSSFWAWAALAWRPWVGLNAACFWSALSAYILFHAFAKRFLDEPWASLLPFFAFWLGAWYSLYGFWDMIAHQQSLSALDLNLHNTSFFSYFFQPPMAFGMPLVLSVLLLSEEKRFWRAGVLAGPLLLANQALFVFWAGYTALAGLLRQKDYLKALGIGIALAIPFLPQLTAREFSNPSEFGIGLPILWLMRAWEPYPATFPIAYILFFFPLLPLYIHGVWLSMRNRDMRRAFLPLVLITGLVFLAPHFIFYISTAYDDIFKFFMLWGVFGLPLTLVSLKELWRHMAWRWVLILSLVPGLFSYPVGLGVKAVQTRRLMGWEKLRPDIIRVNEALRDRGGVLVIIPPGMERFGVQAYMSVSGEPVSCSFERRRIGYIQRIIIGAGIPCYPNLIYGRSAHDYETLATTWPFLEDIPDSLFVALNIKYLALPREAPRPAMAGEPLIRTDNIAIYPLR